MNELKEELQGWLVILALVGVPLVCIALVMGGVIA